MSDVQQPIGIFDSGIGGLTIAKAVIDNLPNDNIIYFGDTAHLPYGDKSPELIKQYCEGISRFLLSKNCKLIIIACNTASSVAYDYLKETLGNKVDFINVVDPLVEGIAALNNIKKIGVIGTQGTVGSNIYANKLKAIQPELEVKSLATPLLAPMIEAGFFNNKISKAIIKSYLKNETIKDIDALVLACTHYPLIKKDIKKYYSDEIKVYDSTDFIAIKVKALLKEKGLLSKSNGIHNEFYVSDFTESFEQTTRLFFGKQVHLSYSPIWENQTLLDA